jgi:hypothetical protein
MLNEAAALTHQSKVTADDGAGLEADHLAA